MKGQGPKIRQDMAGLDLKTRDLSRLEAKLLLVHGRDDAIIPYTECLGLAAALPPERVSVYIVDHLAHVGLGQVGPIDSLVLWRAAYDFLTARDVLARGGDPARRASCRDQRAVAACPNREGRLVCC